MKPSPTRLYGLIGLMTFFWSINFVITKIALRSFPPLMLATFRTVLAALVLLPVYYWRRRREAPGHPVVWTPREWLTLVALGIFGVALNQLCFVGGMQRTSVAHGSLIIATTPMLVLLLARLRGQELLSRAKLCGMGVAIGGVAVLQVGRGGVADRGASLGGDLLVLSASAAFALYSVAGKEVSRRHGSIVVNTFGYLAGALAVLPLFIHLAREFPFAQVSAGSWIALAYMTLFPSVVCYLIYYYALTHIPASRVAAFSYTQPLIAAVTGLAVLGEPITLEVAAGGALVLAGVWVSGKG